MSEAYAFSNHDFTRANERKKYLREIVFSHSDDMYRGVIRNISLGGAQIEADRVDKIGMGDIVTVCIPFSSGERNVRRKGRIVRKDGKGFAIEFLPGH